MLILRIEWQLISIIFCIFATSNTYCYMDIEASIRLRDFSCGLFFMFQIIGTLALFLKGRTHRLQRSAFHFMLYLLLISVFEAYVFFIHNFLGEQERPVTNLLQITVVPLALLFLYRLTHTQGMRPILVVLNFIPYVIAFVSYICTLSKEIYDGIMLIALVHAISIIVYGFIAVRQFNKTLVANFSSDEHRSLHWLWLFLLLYIALGCVWLWATWSGSLFVTTFYNITIAVILALLCYFVYRQEDMLENLGKVESDTIKDDNNKDHLKDYHFADSFENVFSIDRIYLNPKLNINDLARALGTNRTYVSNYINQHLHTTFYEYVNKWRITRAKQLLLSTSLPLEDIAEQSGFNSLSSFRRYFVSSENMTPMAYRKFRGK